ncbi:MAG: nucleotidyltransferase family protein [Nitrosomonadaceae bacterium]
MNKKNRFSALVLAADRTTHDPVASSAGTSCKAIAPIGGIPMIIRVLDALESSEMIGRIIICGPPASVLPDCPELQKRIESGRVDWLPNLDSPSRSANSGLAQIDHDSPVLLTTADHALLTPAIIRYFLRESSAIDSDATVGVVKHADVSAAFPGTRRTVIRLRDGGVCGCNLYAFFNHRGRDLVTFWQRAEDLRKRPWRLILQVLGPGAVLSYLMGQLTLNQALNAVSSRVAVKVRTVTLPYPQAGVDVDKVEDMMLVESILAGGAFSFENGGESKGRYPDA